MKPYFRFTPMLPSWLFALWGAVLLLACSCMTMTLPRTVVLEPAIVWVEQYPYMLSAEVIHHVYVNASNFHIGDTRVPELNRIFLKRDSGVLEDGDFFVASPGGNYPMKSRGRVIFEGNAVTVDAETGVEANPGSGVIVWTKSQMNGRYQLIRSADASAHP